MGLRKPRLNLGRPNRVAVPASAIQILLAWATPSRVVVAVDRLRLTFPEAAMVVYILLLFVPLGFWTLRTMQAVGRTRYANS